MMFLSARHECQHCNNSSKNYIIFTYIHTSNGQLNGKKSLIFAYEYNLELVFIYTPRKEIYFLSL